LPGHSAVDEQDSLALDKLFDASGILVSTSRLGRTEIEFPKRNHRNENFTRSIQLGVNLNIVFQKGNCDIRIEQKTTTHQGRSAHNPSLWLLASLGLRLDPVSP
jgi:hypothetical protein